jgi:hypothetical protein
MLIAARVTHYQKLFASFPETPGLTINILISIKVNGQHDINCLESALEEKKKVFFSQGFQEGLRGNDAISENLSLIKIALN